MSEPLVLDPASGSRMMYFDKADDRVLFGDIRTESHILCDGRAPPGGGIAPVCAPRMERRSA